MTLVVFDTSVIVSAIFWPQSTARRALVGLATHHYFACLTAELFAEYERVAAELQREFPGSNSAGSLAWLRSRARWFEPAPLGKQRSRDRDDEPVLACALAARGRFTVTSDRDLLNLQKPFGIAVVTPAEFLRAIGPTA